jgi:hypothetical protein
MGQKELHRGLTGHGMSLAIYMPPKVTTQVTWVWSSCRRVCRNTARGGVTLLVSTIVVVLTYDEMAIPG